MTSTSTDSPPLLTAPSCITRALHARAQEDAPSRPLLPNWLGKQSGRALVVACSRLRTHMLQSLRTWWHPAFLALSALECADPRLSKQILYGTSLVTFASKDRQIGEAHL